LVDLLSEGASPERCYIGHILSHNLDSSLIGFTELIINLHNIVGAMIRFLYQQVSLLTNVCISRSKSQSHEQTRR